MAVNLSPVGGVAGQFFDNNGDPLSGGKLYTYAAATTTPQTNYTSSSGAIANTNPIILNSGGRVPAEIWLTDGLSYKFVLYTSDNVLLGTWDNINGINSNFVNFTNSQEIQTATSGQTVFTLATMTYQPNTNSITVYVDGINQYGPGALYAYLETNSTTITFNTGLTVGAEVKFTTSQQNTSSTFTFPSGGIIMWSGSIGTIPGGWFLCDGTNSTPNLTDRFVVMAGGAYPVGTSGGSANSIVPSHSHTASSGIQSANHNHGVGTLVNSAVGDHLHTITTVRDFSDQGNAVAGSSDFFASGTASTNGAGAHNHTISGSTDNNSVDHNHVITVVTEGVSPANANLPPYYALAYIMKS